MAYGPPRPNVQVPCGLVDARLAGPGRSPAISRISASDGVWTSIFLGDLGVLYYREIHGKAEAHPVPWPVRCPKALRPPLALKKPTYRPGSQGDHENTFPGAFGEGNREA